MLKARADLKILSFMHERGDMSDATMKAIVEEVWTACTKVRIALATSGRVPSTVKVGGGLD